MSSVNAEFCAGLPDWPGCEEFNQPDNQDMDNSMGKMDNGYMEEEETNPFMGQLTYTTTAVMVAANAALTLWRYDDKNDASSADGFFEGRNWATFYRDVITYSELVFFGVASLTQIATLFGALADINLMVWWYGSMIMGLVSLVIEAAMWMAREQIVNDPNGSVYAIVEADMVKYTARGASLTLTLWMEYENWMAAQWALLDEETQNEWENDMLFSILF